jgi:hypothetical protein
MASSNALETYLKCFKSGQVVFKSGQVLLMWLPVVTGYELEGGDQTRGRRERERQQGEDKSGRVEQSHTGRVFREQMIFGRISWAHL